MSKPRRNPFQSRNFSMERLEDRQMMAADVGAYVQSGALNIVESAGWVGGDNGVSVVQIAPGTMRVTGLQTDDGGVSRVNGHAYQDFSGVTSLNINLGGGNDLVDVGRDGVNTSLSSVDINVDGTNKFNAYGFDYDKVNVINLTTTGRLTIETGIGNDVVGIGKSRIGNNDLGSLTVNTGGGSDQVNIGNVQVKGSLNILTSDSHSTAADSDQVWMQTVSANEGIEVITGSGKDTLTATDVTSLGDILFDTGAGNDTVNLNSIQATDDFFTKLGDGNDTLHETFLRANRLTLDGGAGTDALTTGQDGTVNLLSEVNWETINGKPPITFKPHSPVVAQSVH